MEGFGKCMQAVLDIDKPRLLREAKKKHFREGESFVPLISECAAAILAGNRDFQKIYHAVYDVIRSGEADGMGAAQAAIAALGQAVRGDPKRLQQRDEAAERAPADAPVRADDSRHGSSRAAPNARARNLARARLPGKQPL